MDTLLGILTVFGVFGGLAWGIGMLMGMVPPPFPRLWVRRRKGMEWEHYRAENRWGTLHWHWTVAYQGQVLDGEELFWGDSWWKLIRATWEITRMTGEKRHWRGRTAPCVICGKPSGVGEPTCSDICAALRNRAEAELKSAISESRETLAE